MMKYVSGVLAIFALFGLLWKANEYVAHADDLRLVAMRLEQKIDGDRAKILQQQNWELRKEYKGKSMPTAVEKEIMENEAEILNIREKLNPKKNPGAK